MKKKAAFTLVELLVAMTVVAILGALIFQVISLATQTWSTSRDRISSFQDARVTFQRLQATLSKAVLNSRLDYVDAAGDPRAVGGLNFIPTGVARSSDLHFVSGPASELVPGGGVASTPGHAVFFQAPLGVTDDPNFSRGQELLNSTGFFVEFGEDQSPLPSFVSDLAGSNLHRFRLKQWVQPAEDNTIYASTGSAAPAAYFSWFQSALPSAAGEAPPAGAIPARTLAEDVFALLMVPTTSPEDATTMGGEISSDFRFDSRAWTNLGGMPISGSLSSSDGNLVPRATLMRNQLPPLVKVALFALERRDADRLQRLHGQTAPPELAIPSDLFTDAANFDDDVLEFEQRLLAQSPPIRARIFRTTIPISAAQWINN